MSPFSINFFLCIEWTDNPKFVDSRVQCFAFTYQAKIQMLTAICSIVKLIFWNLVNLSHLHKKFRNSKLLNQPKLRPQIDFLEKPTAGLCKKDYGWDNFEMVGKRHHLFYFKWAALSWQATALYCKKSSRIAVDI